MPTCYLLTLTVGSSLDQQTNNVTLFNLVEQVNVSPRTVPAAGSRIPLEVHAYLSFSAAEIGRDFNMRFALVSSSTGLEMYSEPASHRAAAPRVRTRTTGLPFPSHLGHYDLRVEFRAGSQDAWVRDACHWPISFLEVDERPVVTH
jgi:hypothetical protein